MPDRLDALSIMGKMHEFRPEIFDGALFVQTWEAMNFRYISEVKEGAIRVIRMLPGSMKKVDFRTKSLPLQSRLADGYGSAHRPGS